MIRGYIAQSVDGYVADGEGGVDFLDPFQDVDYGFAAFMDEIGTVVMGRTTYEQLVSFDMGWPYEGKRGIVVTSSPLDAVIGDAEAWTSGVPALADRLTNVDGDAWIVGGPRLQATFIEGGWLERLEVFVMPVLLGGGVPLFPSDSKAQALRLHSTRTFDKGIVRLDYRRT
jgi:dihydrofolate reductase